MSSLRSFTCGSILQGQLSDLGMKFLQINLWFIRLA
jgi:hypothetical protein